MASIVLITGLTLFYTIQGGMTAVIWTDVVQMCLYVFGAVLSLIVILGKIPGGWPHAVAVAGAAHKFAIFDFHFAPRWNSLRARTRFGPELWAACFLTTASHGTISSWCKGCSARATSGTAAKRCWQAGRWWLFSSRCFC